MQPAVAFLAIGSLPLTELGVVVIFRVVAREVFGVHLFAEFGILQPFVDVFALRRISRLPRLFGSLFGPPTPSPADRASADLHGGATGGEDIDGEFVGCQLAVEAFGEIEGMAGVGEGTSHVAEVVGRPLAADANWFAVETHRIDNFGLQDLGQAFAVGDFTDDCRLGACHRLFSMAG